MACGVCREKKVKCKPLSPPSLNLSDGGNPDLQITSLDVATCVIDHTADMHHCRRPQKAHLRILQGTSPQSLCYFQIPSFPFRTIQNCSRARQSHGEVLVLWMHAVCRGLEELTQPDNKNRSTTRSAIIPRDADTLAPRGELARDV
jgi:hypothetical protein